MDGKWTPGPWSAGPHDDAETAAMFWYVFGPSGSIIVEIDEGADNVVSTCIGSGARPESVAANAHLIAAAPDLYAALKGAIEWMACVEGPLRDGATFKRNLESYRAALAKARGEA